MERFIDTPDLDVLGTGVKFYSSGMKVRLAFSVAAHLEPEILLVDEVLAVGDAAFQKKCLGKMEDVAKEGRTVLFVSHQMAAVENLCPRSILLDQGQVVRDDKTGEVLNHYLQAVLEPVIRDCPLAERTDRTGSGQIKFTSFHMEDSEGNVLACAKSGMEVVFVFGFECPNGDLPVNVDIGFSIHSTVSNQTYSVLYSSYLNSSFEVVPQAGKFRCKVERFPFSPGRYRIGGRMVINNIEADWPQAGRIGHDALWRTVPSLRLITQKKP